jgi:hypothetical protein
MSISGKNTARAGHCREHGASLKSEIRSEDKMNSRAQFIILLLGPTVVFLSSCSRPQTVGVEIYPATSDKEGWCSLLAKDLSSWIYKEGSWALEDGALARKGGGDIWKKEKFSNFILDLEFKVDKDTNSGVFFRTDNINDPVQTGIEVQILDSYGKTTVGKYDCGAIYDCLAPTKNMVKKPMEWNRLTITAKANRVMVVMNGEQIINMDLSQWTEAGKNPDGTKNKFRTAYKDMPRVGHIGFQDHGKPVWFRNIRIEPLAK